MASHKPAGWGAVAVAARGHPGAEETVEQELGIAGAGSKMAATRRLARLNAHLAPSPAPAAGVLSWLRGLFGSPEDPPAGEAAASRVSRASWGDVNGEAVELVTLRNAAGVEASVLTLGCVLQSVLLPTEGGQQVDVVLGYDTLDEYRMDTEPPGKSNFGSIVGRYANRIPGGRFALEGTEYTLPPNAGPTALHGGAEGLFTKVFSVESVEEETASASAAFTYTSPDGEAGYPAALSVTFICTLNDDNELTLEYLATADAPTICSLTNHSYWNLNGHDGSSVMDQELVLNCSHYTPTDPDNESVPTGEVRSDTFS